MKSVTLLTAAVVVFALSCGTGQVKWVRVVDCGADEVGAGLASNGNMLVVLGTKTTPRLGSVWVMQALQPDGELRWRREYSQGSNSFAGDAVMNRQGELFACGTCVLKGKDMCVVVRVQADGRLAWQRALEMGEASRAKGIYLTDSALFVCGSVQTKEGQEVMVAVLDPEQGKTKWSRNYNFGPVAEATALVANIKGEIVFVGQAGTAENPDIIIGRLKANGDTLWTRRYDSGAADRPGGVVFDVFGNVVATGTGQEGDAARCVILEYLPDGGLIRKTAYHEQVTAQGRQVAATPGGDLFVAGRIKTPAGWQMLAFQYRPAATSIWERTWAKPGADVSGEDVFVEGDVFALGTIDKKDGGRDMVVVRFTRPEPVKQQ